MLHFITNQISFIVCLYFLKFGNMYIVTVVINVIYFEINLRKSRVKCKYFNIYFKLSQTQECAFKKILCDIV